MRMYELKKMKGYDMQNRNYIQVEDYALKGRIYPTKAQQKQIDDILHGVHVYKNEVLYDVFVNHRNTKEKVMDDGQVIHYPDFSKMWKADYKKELVERHPIIAKVPSSALTGNNGVVLHNIKQSFAKCYENEKGAKPVKGQSLTIEKIESNRRYNKNLKYRKGDGTKPKKLPIVHYSSKSNPIKTYTYQDLYSKFIFGDNPNVIKAKLTGIDGTIKIRGLRKDLLFQHKDADTEFVDFKTYCTLCANQRKAITIQINRGTCNDYYIILKLPEVFIPQKINQHGIVGVDVGEISVAVCSNGETFAGMNFDKYNKKIDKLNRQLSRRRGYKNHKFVDENKEQRKESGVNLQPSKRYEKTKLEMDRLYRKKKNTRNDYYNKISNYLATNYEIVNTESLSVSDMLIKKEREVEKTTGEEQKEA